MFDLFLNSFAFHRCPALFNFSYLASINSTSWIKNEVVTTTRASSNASTKGSVMGIF